MIQSVTVNLRRIFNNFAFRVRQRGRGRCSRRSGECSVRATRPKVRRAGSSRIWHSPPTSPPTPPKPTNPPTPQSGRSSRTPVQCRRGCPLRSPASYHGSVARMHPRGGPECVQERPGSVPGASEHPGSVPRGGAPPAVLIGIPRKAQTNNIILKVVSGKNKIFQKITNSTPFLAI